MVVDATWPWEFVARGAAELAPGKLTRGTPLLAVLIGTADATFDSALPATALTMGTMIPVG